MIYQQALENADLVYADGFGKGFPLWTENGLMFQQRVIKILIDLFKNEFEFIVNWPNIIRPEEEYKGFYQDRIAYYDSIPTFRINNQRNILITDALPYNIRRLDMGKTNAILTDYHVIRLLSCKQIPMYRDYYISPLLQLNLWVDQKQQATIEYVLRKLHIFLQSINLPSVILEYDGCPGYSSRVFMASSQNKKGGLQAIIQCSLLSNYLLNQFGVKGRCLKGYTFDIGFSQKLFALLADNNSDENGFYIPSLLSDFKAVIIYNKKLPKKELLEELITSISIEKEILITDKLGELKLNKMAKEYGYKGVGMLLIHRNEDGKEFFTCFSRSRKDSIKIDNIEELKEFLLATPKNNDRYFYGIGMKSLDKIQKRGFGKVSEFKKSGRVVIIEP